MMPDPNRNILTWLRTADNATREQAVSLCGDAADEIEQLRIALEAAEGGLTAAYLKGRFEGRAEEREAGLVSRLVVHE
jgi:hypothetical protein